MVDEDQIRRARQLFEVLTQGGRQPDDRTLARSPQYREFLALGIDICQEMSAAEFDQLSDQLYGPADPRSAAAAPLVRHLWAGLSRLYGRSEAGFGYEGDSMSGNEDYVMPRRLSPEIARRDRARSQAGLPRQGHPVKLQ